MMDPIREFLASRGQDVDSVEAYIQSELVVSAKNPHPSALQNRMISEHLYDALQRGGVLQRMMR